MKRAALLSLVCFGLAGCATTGVQSGYLDDYGKLKSGRHLKGFHSEAALAAIQTVKVGEVDTTHVRGPQTGLAAEGAAYFRNDMQTAAKKHGMDSYFIFESDAPTDATLNLALTNVDPGDANSRMWAGELGMGHAMVQAEGRVVANDGKELASFSEQRRSSGGAGLRDLGGDSGPTLVKEMLSQLAENIVREFKAVREK